MRKPIRGIFKSLFDIIDYCKELEEEIENLEKENAYLKQLLNNKNSQNQDFANSSSSTSNKNSSNRIPWNMYEAAVLLDALINIKNKKIKKSDAVIKVSEKLRKMAINQGYKIDDTFRNTNGISWQIEHLEYAFTDGKSGMADAWKWQKEIVEIYRDNREQFDKLLKTANDIIDNNYINNKNKDNYSETNIINKLL